MTDIKYRYTHVKNFLIKPLKRKRNDVKDQFYQETSTCGCLSMIQ